MARESFGGPSFPDGSHLAARLRQLADAREWFYAVRLQALRGHRLVGQPWPAAVIRQPLAALAENASAALYALGDADFVLLCDNLSVDFVDDAINRALRLFHTPASYWAGSPPTAKVSWYDLVRDDDFQSLLSAAEASHETRRRGRLADSTRAITVADVPAILGRIDQLPLARMVRRQSVLRVEPAGKFESLFQQLDIPIPEFQRALAPGLDITAHPDLFDLLGAELEQSFLTFLVGESGRGIRKGRLCIALRLSTAELPIFDKLIKLLSPKDKLLIEVPLSSIIDNIYTFYCFRTRMKERGIAIILGNVTFPDFFHLDLAALDADFIKVQSPEALSGASEMFPQALERNLDRLGRDRVVLSGLETEECLKWALRVGITRFQGLFADKLISTLAMKQLLRPGALT